MLVGIFLSSLGVSLSIKSGLGATPIGVCPAVFSPFFNISTGTAMGILLAIFLLVQFIMLKRAFQPVQFLQFGMAVIYSCFVDLFARLLSGFPDEVLWQQIIYCGLGIVTLATGVFIMVKADFFMLPQDAAVKVASDKYQKEYGKVKIALDVGLTIIAGIGSWIIYRCFNQVGPGTVVAAIFVGRIINRLRGMKKVDKLLDRALRGAGKNSKHKPDQAFVTPKDEQTSRCQSGEKPTAQCPDEVTQAEVTQASV